MLPFGLANTNNFYASDLEEMMANTLMRPRTQRKAWEVCLLLSACTVPFYGGAAALLMLVACLSLIVRARGALTPCLWRASAWMTGTMLLYLSYFYVVGAVRSDAFLIPTDSLRENILFLIAGIAVAFLPAKTTLTASSLGRWMTAATLVISLFGIGAWLVVESYNWAQQSRLSDLFASGELRLLSKNPNIFSHTFSFVAFLSLAGLGQRHPLELWLAVIAIALGFITVSAVAEARGAMLTFVILSIFSVIWLRPRRQSLFLGGAVIVIVGIVLLATVPILQKSIIEFSKYMISSSIELVGPLEYNGSSNSQRIVMIEGAWEAWKAAPWFGYGYENRFSAIMPFMDFSLVYEYEHAHNALLNHMVAGGVVGLTIFLVFMALPIIILLSAPKDTRSRDQWFVALVIVLVAFSAGMTNAIMGHFIHATSFGGLMLSLVAMQRSEPKTVP